MPSTAHIQEPGHDTTGRLAFVKRHEVVLEAGRGPVPNRPWRAPPRRSADPRRRGEMVARAATAGSGSLTSAPLELPPTLRCTVRHAHARTIMGRRPEPAPSPSPQWGSCGECRDGCTISSMRRSWVAALLLTALVVFGLTAPTRAHVLDRAASLPVVQVAEVDVRNSGPTVPAPVSSVVAAVPASPTVPLIPLLVLAASLIPAFRSRRAVAGLLMVLLAMFAFEAGVHSVHHIGDQDEAARCVVASASSSLSGAIADPGTLVAPAATDDVAPPLELGTLPQRFALPDQGRAPPFLG